MIPVAQLDPASLALWLDPSIVCAGPDGEIIREALHYALLLDFPGVRRCISNTRETKTVARIAYFASSIWHEYRHFLDIVLTNYGAFRVRQYFSIYSNIHVLAIAARNGHSVFFPLDAYADPVRSMVNGLEGAPDELIRLAKDVKDRKNVIEDDRAQLMSINGAVEFGGHAQMEALAYHCQEVAIARHLGIGVASAKNAHFPESKMIDARYKWAQHTMVGAGLAPVKEYPGIGEVIDLTILPAMLIASLSTRHFGQQQVRTEIHSSAFAAERFAGLFSELTSHTPPTTSEDAWSDVNNAAKRLWGRTIVEELTVDYKLEGDFFSKITSDENTSAEVKDVLSDYHALRGKMLDLLKSDPGQIVDPMRFSDELLPRLQPFTVAAIPAGHVGALPEGVQKVFGYSEPEDSGPDARWAWAVTPRNWPMAATDDALALDRRDSWMTVVSELAPLAKLMLNGRNHRIILGPEILKAEAQLSRSGIQFRIDPYFRFPPELTDGDFFFDLSGRISAICDVCHQRVERGDCVLVSPWVLRNDGAYEFFSTALGAGREGRLRFLRDWSVWLMCNGCHQRLAKLLDAGFDGEMRWRQG